MSWLGWMLRRARIRGLVEALVQRGRAEASDDDAKDDVERWQDYGLAAQPVDGQGLVINAGGHTIVLRMDRLAERPQLAAYEVAIWHKEGHTVRLKAGRLVQVDCDDLLINASNSVAINTQTFALNAGASAGITSPDVSVDASSGVAITAPLVDLSADLHAAGTVTGDTDVLAAGTSGHSHTHSNVEAGTDSSGGPNP